MGYVRVGYEIWMSACVGKLYTRRLKTNPSSGGGSLLIAARNRIWERFGGQDNDTALPLTSILSPKGRGDVTEMTRTGQRVDATPDP